MSPQNSSSSVLTVPSQTRRDNTRPALHPGAVSNVAPAYRTSPRIAREASPMASAARQISPLGLPVS
jgi:hypothetical protein